jgi:hypothetical protein
VVEELFLAGKDNLWGREGDGGRFDSPVNAGQIFESTTRKREENHSRITRSIFVRTTVYISWAKQEQQHA